MFSIRTSLPLLMLTLGNLVACSDASTGSSRAVTLSFSATQPSASSALAGTGAASLQDVTSSDGKLVISKAELVIREIELGDDESEGQTCEVASHDDDCEDLELGPLLVDVPLVNGTVDKQLTVSIPPGTYSKLEFKVQPPTRGNNRDAAFRAANPLFAAKSVHVAGTYNGAAFDLYLPADASLEVGFASPLVVTSDPANVTVQVDVLSWFTRGVTIDPATVTPGSAAEGAVVENIKRSFHAFEDENEDGHEDRSGPGN
jgi:hypothetical protein